MRRLRSREGFIKPLLMLAILAALAYAGFQFGMPYYRYSAFKSEVKAITQIELGDVKTTKAEVYEAAQKYKIPVGEEDIRVTKEEKTVRVQTEWSVTVDLFGLYQRTLDFEVNIEE